MNRDKAYFYSLPIQWLFIVMVMTGVVGCSNTHTQRQEAAREAFTNQEVEVKATTYFDQFVVRCEDGSIWEVKVKTNQDGYNNIPAPVYYKNCLFDPLYKLPEKPIAPQLPLEKTDKSL